MHLTLCLLHPVQGGQETDFILVSCSGAGVPNESREKVLRAKQVYQLRKMQLKCSIFQKSLQVGHGLRSVPDFDP